MNAPRDVRRVHVYVFLLVFALAGNAAVIAPVGTTAGGIEVSDFEWRPRFTLEGKVLEEFNFRVSLGNHRTNSIQNIQLRIFFYDEQERPLTNVLLKCLARIPAGGKTCIDGYVDERVRSITFAPAKSLPEDTRREERIAELAKREAELKVKCDELRIEIDLRAIQLRDLERTMRNYPEMGDFNEQRRLIGEILNLELQLREVSVLRVRTTLLKEDVSRVRPPREWLRQGIYNGNLIGTNKCRLEFEVQGFDVVE